MSCLMQQQSRPALERQCDATRDWCMQMQMPQCHHVAQQQRGHDCCYIRKLNAECARADDSSDAEAKTHATATHNCFRQRGRRSSNVPSWKLSREPPPARCCRKAGTSRPLSFLTAPKASETAITVAPCSAKICAAHAPTLPKPCACAGSYSLSCMYMRQLPQPACSQPLSKPAYPDSNACLKAGDVSASGSFV